MKIRIEPFTSLTGWTINSPSQIALNEFKEYIVGLRNEASLIAQFSANDTIRTLTKLLTPIDVTDYEYLILSVWSETKGKQVYGRNIISDFNYKIKINATDEYLLPVYNSFTDVNINIKDVTSIDRIEITALHSNTDTIILSEMVAELEELPIDLLEEMKDMAEYYIEQEVGKGFLLGTMSGTAEDIEILIGDYNYINRYSVITIDDGVNTESHQIHNLDECTLGVTFNDNYDGKSLINTFVDANVYLAFPVYINPDERDVRLPGLCIWGVTPEPILRTGKLDTFIEAYKADGSMIERTEGQVWNNIILMDCESRSSSAMAVLSKICRLIGGNELIWVNGRKHELDFGGSPTETKPQQGIDIIPKIQYTINVETIEQLKPAEDIAKTETINIDINVEENDG